MNEPETLIIARYERIERVLYLVRTALLDTLLLVSLVMILLGMIFSVNEITHGMLDKMNRNPVPSLEQPEAPSPKSAPYRFIPSSGETLMT